MLSDRKKSRRLPYDCKSQQSCIPVSYTHLVLAYAEMFTIAKQIAARVSSIMPLFVAGLFYYIFNFVVAFIMERIEKKLSYYK